MVVADPMAKSTVKISVTESSADESDDINSSDDDLREQNDDVGKTSSDEDIEEKQLNDRVENNEDSDNEADQSSSEDENTEGSLMTNEGWADSVAKILSSSKPKNKKTLVLSRAKKHSEIVKKEKPEKPSFEVIGESEEKPVIKKEVKVEKNEEPPVKKVKHEKPSIRMKPNVLEKDRERLLSKIATKGVVQLFNAVRNQQKTLNKDLERTDLSERKKEKILKKFDKRTFLDTLMGNSKSVIVDEVTTTKDEVKDEGQPKWSVLRDDFMTGAKMKDWDKESIDD